MINGSFKKVLILSLSLLPLTINAGASAGTESLTRQCRDLSLSVSSLIPTQNKQICAEKLHNAVSSLENAADFIVDDLYDAARYELDNSIFDLQYAVLYNCNRYIQISHAKVEAKRIKNAL